MMSQPSVDSTRFPSLDNILGAVSLALGGFSAATLVAIGWLNHTHVPWFDAWSHWGLYIDARDWTFLFRAHNEHWIPVTRLLHQADLAWSRADTTLLLVATFTAQGLSAILIYRLACSGAARHVTRGYVLGLVLAFMFAAPQYINFTWKFQVCFVLVFTAATAALAALAQASAAAAVARGRSGSWVAASLLAGLVATGSMANGLLIWPLLVSLAALLRLSWRAIATVAASGAAAVLAYVSAIERATGQATDIARTPLNVLGFALAYLGSVVDQPAAVIARWVGADWDPVRVWACGLAGLAGICWLAAMALPRLRPGADVKPSALVLLHVAAFVAGSALLTALGRANHPLDYALTSRYVTGALLFWCCLVSLTLARAAIGNAARILLLAAAAFIGGTTQLERVGYAVDAERYVSEGEYALINNVFATEAWGRLYYSPGAMIPSVAFFRARRLSSFSRDWATWIGDSVSERYQVAPAFECTGHWDGVVRLKGSYKPAVLVQGWAFDRKFRRPPERLVFVDDDQRIVGFATGTRARPDLDQRYPHLAARRVGWVAFLPARAALVSAYVVLGDGRLCPIGSGQIPDTFETSAPDRPGPAVPGVAASGDGWTSDPPPEAPVLNPGRKLWSSHQLKDGRGVLRLGPVKMKGGDGVCLPFVIGAPSQSIRLTGEELASSRLTANAAWAAFRFELPPGAPGMTVDFVIHDGDAGPGGWVVVSGPQQLLE